MSRWFAVAVLYGLSYGTILASALDCGKAVTPIDKTLCSQTDLAHMDSDLNKLYVGLRPQLTPKGQAQLLAQQRAWLAERDRVCVGGDIVCFRKAYQERVDQLQALNAAAAVAEGKLSDVTPVVVEGTWKATAVQDPGGAGHAGNVNIGQSIQFADLPAVGSFVGAAPGKVCLSHEDCATIAWARSTVAEVESMDDDLGLHATDQVFVGRYVADKSPHLVLVPRTNGVVWAIFDLCASNQMHCRSAIEVWTPIAAKAAFNSLR